MFHGGSSSGGFGSVSSSMAGVTCHVGCSGSMTSCSGGRSGRNVLGIAGGGVGGNCGGARRPARDLSTQPSARCFNGSARPVVLRMLLLEERKHMLSAVGGPERK